MSIFTYKDCPSAFSSSLFGNKFFSVPITKAKVSNKKAVNKFYTGQKVIHEKFGRGKVKFIEDEIVEVIFGKNKKMLSTSVVLDKKLLWEDE